MKEKHTSILLVFMVSLLISVISSATNQDLSQEGCFWIIFAMYSVFIIGLYFLKEHTLCELEELPKYTPGSEAIRKEIMIQNIKRKAKRITLSIKGLIAGYGILIVYNVITLIIKSDLFNFNIFNL